MLAEGISFWTTLLNDFQGRFLRVFDVFPYFNVWGNWKCQETILFRKKRWGFWGFKNSVHLGLKEQIFTRNCLSDVGGCRFPNRAWFSFLEIPRSLVYCPKISDPNALFFRTYRSWNTVYHRRSEPEQQHLWIVFEGFPASIEVIRFLRIPRHVIVYSGIFFWNLG